MAKMRVYELARELSLESKALVTKIKEIGIEVSSHQSTLTAAQVTKIRDGLKGESAKKPKVVVRRRKKKPEDTTPQMEAVVDGPGAQLDVPVREIEEPNVPSETSKADELDSSGQVSSGSDPSIDEVSSIDETEHSDKSLVEQPKTVDAQVDAVAHKVEEVGSASKLSKATQALVSKRTKEKKSDVTFESAKIVRKTDSSPTTEDKGRYKVVGTAKPNRSSDYNSTPKNLDDYSGVAFSSTNTRSKLGDKRKPFEEVERVRPTFKKDKRNSVSTRDLLQQHGDEDSDDLPAQRKGRKRTVYTPSSGTKRRDLKRRKDLKKTEITMPRASLRIVTMEDTVMTVGALAKSMSVKAGEVIKKLMSSGEMVSINEKLDADTVALIASEFGFEVKSNVRTVDDLIARPMDSEESITERPPIVTIMGHVDHGKTSILDAIRETQVASGEAGGITQHIGAYTVERNSKHIAFLDTPGHAAFSSMRARGAELTDICVIVVAADDGVMPQTVEAISHAKSSNVAIIVAINKMDKQGINLDRVYNELAEHGIQSEEWGGDYQFVKVSALERTGLDELTDAILLQAEMLELKGSSDGPARGTIIEANLDKGRGPVATVMVTAGTLRKGDIIVAGETTGRVRTMVDHLGKKVDAVGPSTPVEVIGLTDVPMAGDQVDAVKDDKIAAAVIDKRAEILAKERGETSSRASLEDLLSKVASEQIPEIPFIVKADTQGSAEAICDALLKIESEKIKAKIIHKGVGGINSTDLSLAETTGSVLFGFNVRAARGLSDEAENRGLTVKYFSIIYELIDAAKAIMKGNLPPIESEVVLGHAEIRSAISVPKIGTIAGSAVLDGKIVRNCHLRLIRDDVVVHSGKVGSLRRFKDDVREVNTGYECGIGIEGYNDLKIGDVIEAFTVEKSEASL